MQKLDRLGWASGIAFSIAGIRVGIRTNLTSLPEELTATLPHRRKTLPANSTVDFLYSLKIVEPHANQRFKRFHLAFAGATVIGRSLETSQVLDNLESDLRKLIAESS